MSQTTTPVLKKSSAPASYLHRLNTTVSLLIVYLVMCLFFAFVAPNFFSVSNFVNIGQTLAVVGIIAIGQTMVIINGGVDISVGATAALAGVVTSLLWDGGVLPIWGCVVMGLLSGGAVGLVNGLSVTKLKINPLITTLAMFSIVRGLAFVLTGGRMNQLSNPQFQLLGRGDVLGIPLSLILMIILYLFFGFVLQRISFGRDLYAIGGSPMASRLAGIPVSRYSLLVYILCGVLAALGGTVLAAQLAAGTPQAAAGLELTVVAAVILGGCSLAGGKGTLVGTMLGVLILRTLDNGLVLMDVSSYYQEVARGAVLLLAVGFDQIRLKMEVSA